MGKKKSVALIVIMVIVLAGLAFISVASFALSSPNYFTPLISHIQLSTDLGGGYYTVYYPEGVISQEEYELLVNSDTDSDAAETYTRHKGVYLSDEVVDANGTVRESFRTEFDTAFRVMQERFEGKNYSGHSVKLQDDYTIRVEIPYTEDETISTLFDTLGSSGAAYFADSSGNEMMELTSDSVSGVSIGIGTDGNYGLIFDFTSDGQEEFADATSTLISSSSDSSTSSGLTETSATMYLYVGDTAVLQTTIESALNQPSVYVGGGFESAAAADTIVCLVNSALDEDDVFDLALDAPEYYEFTPTMGENAGLIVAITFGALALIMAIYSIIRYKGMGLAHVFGFITFGLLFIICLALLGTVVLNMAGVLAILITATLMCGFDWYAFKNIAEEFATGKTLTASIKAGYNRSIALTIDVHVLVFAAALILSFIATGAVFYAATILVIGTLLSAACTLGVTRFFFYVLLALPKRKIAFCNFKREETEDA